MWIENRKCGVGELNIWHLLRQLLIFPSLFTSRENFPDKRKFWKNDNISI